MGVIDKWNKNVFHLQMNKLNEESRICVNTALNGPEHTALEMNSLRNYFPLFQIFIAENLFCIFTFLFEYSVLSSYLM